MPTRFDTSAGWDSLRQHTACLRRGIKIFEMRTEGMQRQVLEDDKSLLRMLRSGGCDVALMEPNNAEALRQMRLDGTLPHMPNN